MGVFGTVFDFGEAMGPILAGYLIGRFGYTPAFDVIAAATAVAAVALVALVRDPKPVRI
jgi:predicted MFS family arabinose efflux permease